MHRIGMLASILTFSIILLGTLLLPRAARADPVLAILSTVPTLDVNAPYALTLAGTPDNPIAVVAGNQNDTVQSYLIDPHTGAATLAGSAQAAGSGASSAAATSDGVHVIIADAVSNELSLFSVDPTTGSLSRLQVVPSGGQSPVHVSISPNNEQVGVTHSVSDRYVAFHLDQTAGTLSVLDAIDVGNHPSNAVLRNDGSALVLNEGSNDFSVIDQTAGTLSVLDTIPMPAGFSPRLMDGSAGTDTIHIASSTFGASALATLNWDQATGEVTEGPVVPSDDFITLIKQSPDGNTLFTRTFDTATGLNELNALDPATMAPLATAQSPSPPFIPDEGGQMAVVTIPTGVFGAYSSLNETALIGFSYAEAIVEPPFPTPPPPVSDLTAEAVSPNQVNLSWTTSGQAGNSLRVERSLSGADHFEVLSTLPPDALEYSDATASPSTTYDYRVVHYNIYGETPATIATVTTPPALPNAATNLTANAVSSNQVDVTWNDNSNNEGGFRVERTPSGSGAYTPVGTVGPNVETFSDTSVAADTSYDYRVIAFNLSGDGDPSNVVSVTTPILLSLPVAVTALTVVATTTTVSLAWNDNSSNEDGQRVQRAAAGTGSFSDVTTVAPNVETYVDMTVVPGESYDYQIVAFNAFGEAPPSNVATITIPLQENVPAQVNPIAAFPGVSMVVVDIVWYPNSTNEDGFNVERALAGSGLFTVVATVPAGEVSHTDHTVAAETSYDYRVVAFNEHGKAMASNVVTTTTPSANSPCDEEKERELRERYRIMHEGEWRFFSEERQRLEEVLREVAGDRHAEAALLGALMRLEQRHQRDVSRLWERFEEDLERLRDKCEREQERRERQEEQRERQRERQEERGNSRGRGR